MFEKMWLVGGKRDTLPPMTNTDLAAILEAEAAKRPLATVSKHLVEAAKRLREII